MRTEGDSATNIDFDRSSVSDAQWILPHLPRCSGHQPQRPDDEPVSHCDVDDEQWGVNSTLSSGRRGVRRSASSTTIATGKMISSTATSSSRRRRSCREPACSIREPDHELQFISPARSGWTAASTWSPASITSMRSTAQGERLHMNSQFCKIALSARRPICNSFLTAMVDNQNATVQDVHQTVDSYAAYAQANSTSPTSSSRPWADASGTEGRVVRPAINPFLASVRAPNC